MTKNCATVCVAAVGLVALLGVGAPASAQSAENVLVVINDNSADSQRVGEYYVRQRAIPSSNIVHVRTTEDETIQRVAYLATMEGPIALAISRERIQDRILYIVLTKGIPLRIAGSEGPNGAVGSVDSELTLLYRRMTGVPVPNVGRVDNPYFLGTGEISTAERFTHHRQDIYLVSRIDGFTVEDAIAVVDRAKAAKADGRFVLDQRAALVNRTGEDWLELAAKRLQAQGLGERVQLDTSVQGVRDVDNVLGYYSWGSNDPRNRVRTFGMKFAPGALAAMFVSSDLRTLKPPPNDFVPSDSADRAKWFGGSPQSLAGDLLREGATGVAGHVAEPYLQATVRPEILFPAYAAGFNLIESFYLGIPYLSWQTVVIGDPLCDPFPRRPLARQEIEAPLDESLALPGLFAARRLEVAKVRGFANVPEPVVRLAVRADSLLAVRDTKGALAALEEAVMKAPRVLPALNLQLALLYEQSQQYDRAMTQYERVIAAQPNNPAALNNLAYAIAVRKKAPADALPFAKRAVAAAPNDGAILDTMAWILHLTGDSTAASKQILESLRRTPNNPEVRLHAAIIYAAVGAKAVAEDQLKEALRLAPAYETREDVKEVRAAIAKLGASN